MLRRPPWRRVVVHVHVDNVGGRTAHPEVGSCPALGVVRFPLACWRHGRCCVEQKRRVWSEPERGYAARLRGREVCVRPCLSACALFPASDASMHDLGPWKETTGSQCPCRWYEVRYLAEVSRRESLNDNAGPPPAATPAGTSRPAAGVEAEVLTFPRRLGVLCEPRHRVDAVDVHGSGRIAPEHCARVSCADPDVRLGIDRSLFVVVMEPPS